MDADHPGARPLTAVVLAAGSGTRMRSQLPKVLQPVAGRPIVLHVLHAIRDAGLRDVVVVVGEQEDRVRPAIEAAAPDGLNLAFVRQPKPLGTADALLQARAAVTSNELLVLNGDLALLTAAHLQPLLDAAPSRCALATATVADPTGLGRVVRRSDGTVAAIVEEAVADPATLEIQEINTGIYRFNAAWLWRALSTLEPSKGGETYITDVITNLCAGGEHAPGDLIALPLQQQDGPLNVENRRDLARAEAVMQRRIRERWLDHGVTIVDPAAVYIDA
ncbi:MAG: sugar phosphate nucleotidyltransferase, partial [Dehalococcoidia bacterium]